MGGGQRGDELLGIRLAVVPGVSEASPFITYPVQREDLRFDVVGYDMRTGIGGPRPAILTRPLTTPSGRRCYEQ